MPRLRVSDTTPEALAQLLNAQPKGMLMQRDELAGWLGSFNRYTGGAGGERAFWIEAFGARAYTIDRVKNGGDGIFIPHLGLSIIGGIQPDNLASTLLSGDDDGLPARFLYLCPQPVSRQRPRNIQDDTQALVAFRRLDALTMAQVEAGKLSPHLVKLNSDAADMFEAWWKQQICNDIHGQLSSWQGKIQGFCLRLALNFHYLKLSTDNNPDNLIIHITNIKAAIIMIEDYFKPMAKIAFGDAALSIDQKNAATLAKYIRKNNLTEINTRNLQRNIKLPGLNNANVIKGAIIELIEMDWLKPDMQNTGSITLLND